MVEGRSQAPQVMGGLVGVQGRFAVESVALVSFPSGSGGPSAEACARDHGSWGKHAPWQVAGYHQGAPQLWKSSGFPDLFCEL